MLRPDFNKRFLRITPQFIRNRLGFRSPIKSANTNLEDSQLRYDIHNLSAKFTFLENTTNIKNQYIEQEKPDHGTNNSLKSVKATIDNLDKRLRNLEGR